MSKPTCEAFNTAIKAFGESSAYLNATDKNAAVYNFCANTWSGFWDGVVNEVGTIIGVIRDYIENPPSPYWIINNLANWADLLFLDYTPNYGDD